VPKPGLPDGLFSDQKSQFEDTLEDPEMENAVIFSEYFTTIGYILWAFDHFVVIWYIFPTLVYCIKTYLATLAKTSSDRRCQQPSTGAAVPDDNSSPETKTTLFVTTQLLRFRPDFFERTPATKMRTAAS
jgi:hypothetical protein